MKQQEKECPTMSMNLMEKPFDAQLAVRLAKVVARHCPTAALVAIGIELAQEVGEYEQRNM